MTFLAIVKNLVNPFIEFINHEQTDYLSVSSENGVFQDY